MQDTYENNSVDNPRMTADQSAAALSLATKLSEGFMPQPMPEEGATSPQNAPEGMQSTQQPQESKPDESEARFTDMETKMDQMKSEMEIMIKDEISGIKDLIIESLKDDGKES